MNALAMVALCMTVGQLHELDRLPSHAECVSMHKEACKYCCQLENDRDWLVKNIGGYPVDEVGEVLIEAYECRLWWTHAANATGVTDNYMWTLDDCLSSARRARRVHDWQLYGLPPVWPYWRLPCK